MHGMVAQVTLVFGFLLGGLTLGGSVLAQEKIKITSSSYELDAQHKKDCTAAIKSKCEDQVSCTFVPDDDICGDTAPAPSPKVLVTGFMCGFLSLENQTKQKETAALACP
jgi:hypothetical protein